MERDVPVSIMIIGEDSHFGYLMRSYVRRSAHKILYSHPETGVLDIIQNERPSAIILDVDLHAAGGWTLLRSLKSNTETCHIPVVICSWADEKERGILEGASVYLRMPILYGDFLEALNMIGLKSNSKAV
jgi:CheY-like chemotaxis protein